jgi:hypothetical protein
MSVLGQSVDEVRAHGQDHAQGRGRVVGDRGQRGQERGPLLRRRAQRVQLLSQSQRQSRGNIAQSCLKEFGFDVQK